MRGYKILWEGNVVKISGSPPTVVNYCYDKSFISPYGKGKVQGQHCGFWHVFIRLKFQ